MESPEAHGKYTKASIVYSILRGELQTRKVLFSVFFNRKVSWIAMLCTRCYSILQVCIFAHFYSAVEMAARSCENNIIVAFFFPVKLKTRDDIEEEDKIDGTRKKVRLLRTSA